MHLTGTNKDTGLSPFEIVFGRNVRGPLEVLQDMWYDVQGPTLDVCSWVEELGKRLESIRDANEAEITSGKRGFEGSL